MKPELLRIAGLMTLLVGCLCQEASARQWLDKKNVRRFDAEFVRIHDGNVVLMRGGRTQTIPLADLADKDQDFVRHEMESRGKPWLAAAPESLRAWTDSQGAAIPRCSFAWSGPTFYWETLRGPTRFRLSCLVKRIRNSYVWN